MNLEGCGKKWLYQILSLYPPVFINVSIEATKKHSPGVKFWIRDLWKRKQELGTFAVREMVADKKDDFQKVNKSIFIKSFKSYRTVADVDHLKHEEQYLLGYDAVYCDRCLPTFRGMYCLHF